MPPTKSRTGPENVYTPRNVCECDRPNVVKDLNGWVSCLKCGKLPAEELGAATNIDNTYAGGAYPADHGSTEDGSAGQASPGAEQEEGSAGRQEVQSQGCAQRGEQEVSLRTWP